jgi:hypothetical protein
MRQYKNCTAVYNKEFDCLSTLPSILPKFYENISSADSHQGILTEGEGTVQLTSLLRQLVLQKSKIIFFKLKSN